jgi:hypothetical protein
MIFPFGARIHCSHQIFGEKIFFEECKYSEILPRRKCRMPWKIIEESRFGTSTFSKDLYSELYSRFESILGEGCKIGFA